jgi:hypothetical protein
MDASDARWILSALNHVVEGIDRCLTAPRTLSRPNIGTLHFMPMPGKPHSLWGVVKRFPDQPEPFYAVFEVQGEEEPSGLQEAHYTATRRLEAHYLAGAAPILAGLCEALPDGLTPPDTRSAEDFRTLSLRIPRNPFDGDAWKLRYRHRDLTNCVFELEYTYCDVTEVCIYTSPTEDSGPECSPIEQA